MMSSNNSLNATDLRDRLQTLAVLSVGVRARAQKHVHRA